MPIDPGTTLATIRAIAGVAREAGKIELYQQILDLQQTILEAVTENTSLAQSNAELTREVNRLRDELDLARRSQEHRSSLTFRDDAYWRQTDDAEDGPFCPKCLDADGKTIRMTDRKNGHTCCVHCKFCIRTPGYVAPPSPPRRPPGSGWMRGY